MDRPLTQKQEAFSVEYVENGGNASDAYRHAYDAERMTDKQIWEEASKLRAHPKVSQRIADLQEARKEIIQWSDMERLRRLKKAADDEDHRAAISAIAEANKMLGSHAPSKVDNTHANADGSNLAPPIINITPVPESPQGE